MSSFLWRWFVAPLLVALAIWLIVKGPWSVPLL